MESYQTKENGSKYPCLGGCNPLLGCTVFYAARHRRIAYLLPRANRLARTRRLFAQSRVRTGVDAASSGGPGPGQHPTVICAVYRTQACAHTVLRGAGRPATGQSSDVIGPINREEWPFFWNPAASPEGTNGATSPGHPPSIHAAYTTPVTSSIYGATRALPRHKLAAPPGKAVVLSAYSAAAVVLNSKPSAARCFPKNTAGPSGPQIRRCGKCPACAA